MNSISRERLLREYIRSSLQTINEMEGGGDGGSLGYSYGAYYNESAAVYAAGYGGGNPSKMVATFITPFTDAFKTIVAGAKMIATDVVTLLHVAFKAALTTVIPFIGARYDKIFKRRDEKIAKIEEQYRDVFDRTEAALGSGDLKLLAFMANPALFLGGSAALKVPAATKSLLSIATGGISDSALDGAKSKWSDIQERILSGEKYEKKRALREKDELYRDLIESLRSGSGGSIRRKARNESLLKKKNFLREAEEPASKEDVAFLKDVLSNDGVRNALSQLIKQNEDLKNIERSLAKVEDETLREANSMANSVLKGVKNLDDLKKLTQSDPKSSEAIRKLEEIKDPKQKEESVKMLVKNIQDAAKQTFLATIDARKKFFPKDSEQYKKYEAEFGKVKSL